MPLPAIILICIGGALILAGLVLLVVKIVVLIKAARRVGINSMTDVQIVIRKVQGLEPRFRELEKNQAVLTASLQKLADEASALNYLKDELDRATGHIRSIKK
jgi:cell division protein FtsB